MAVSGSVTASLCGSSYDTGIEVHAGTNYFDCPGSTILACNDDYCGNIFGSDLGSQVSFVAYAGQPYYILVGGFNGLTGAYTLNMTGVPWSRASHALANANDNSVSVIDVRESRVVETLNAVYFEHDYTEMVDGKPWSIEFDKVYVHNNTVEAPIRYLGQYALRVYSEDPRRMNTPLRRAITCKNHFPTVLA